MGTLATAFVLLAMALPHPSGPTLNIAWFIGQAPQEADPANPEFRCAEAVAKISIDGFIAGTGTLMLNRREVLTASHVAMVDNNPVSRVDLQFRTREHSIIKVSATVVTRGNFYMQSDKPRNYTGDWAILLLDDPVAIEPLAPFTGDFAELRAAKGELTSYGYPHIFKEGEVAAASVKCAIDAINPHIGLYTNNCFSGKDSSGGPIVLKSTNGKCLVTAIQTSVQSEPTKPIAYSHQTANSALPSGSFSPPPD
jgi:hypothetical protein